jgi:hypothetical protein
MVLIGEEMGGTTALSADTPAAPVTFSTMESALNWLIESPETRDVRVTAISKERPVRHVVGSFTLDPALESLPEPDQAEPDQAGSSPTTT